jgi:hypothetical protein
MAPRQPKVQRGNCYICGKPYVVGRVNGKPEKVDPATGEVHRCN